MMTDSRSNFDMVQVYKEMIERSKNNPSSEDQRNLNEIVHKNRVHYRVLDPKRFLCGLDYYEKPERYFADTAAGCTDCVVIHNNWIVSRPAKVYRFKEMLQWVVDLNQYYSSTSERYLTYSNTDNKADGKLEETALINALAISQILNRTLIMPRFHCDKDHKVCPFNSKYYIRHFDQYFPRYRESLFLSNPKVPKSVVENQSPLITINSLCLNRHNCYVPSDISRGVQEEEIREWFGNMRSVSVLRFVNMKTAFSGFSNKLDQERFDGLIRAGLIKAKYRQF